MNRVIVGIGSNIDPYAHIERALFLLAKDHRLLRSSSLKVTVPVGFTEQPDFVNGAALLETELDFDRFVNYLKSVETMLGRIRSPNKFGPRTIDLDIVVWNGAIIDEDYNRRDFLRNAVDELGS